MLTSYPGFARCVAILRYTFMRVRMDFGRNKILYGRSKVENGRTKWIVLGQIVHALFISNFILCYLLALTFLVFASFLYALGEMAYTSTFKQHHFILWIFSAMTSSLVGAFATLGLLVAIYLPISATCIYHKRHQYQEINSQAHGIEPFTLNRSDPVDVPSHTTWDSPHSSPFGLMSSNKLLVAT